MSSGEGVRHVQWCYLHLLPLIGCELLLSIVCVSV